MDWTGMDSDWTDVQVITYRLAAAATTSAAAAAVIIVVVVAAAAPATPATAAAPGRLVWASLVGGPTPSLGSGHLHMTSVIVGGRMMSL